MRSYRESLGLFIFENISKSLAFYLGATCRSSVISLSLYSDLIPYRVGSTVCFHQINIMGASHWVLGDVLYFLYHIRVRGLGEVVELLLHFVYVLSPCLPYSYKHMSVFSICIVSPHFRNDVSCHVIFRVLRGLFVCGSTAPHSARLPCFLWLPGIICLLQTQSTAFTFTM